MIEMALIPNTPRPMMWNDVCFVPLLLFRQVIKKEVDENCVDLCFWLELDDLAAEQFDGPNTAAWIK
jgi:hypothetical protein